MVRDSDEGPALGIHLGMAGRIVVDGDEAGDPRPRVDRERWDRFTIDFEDGGRLTLRDSRRLGRVRLEPAIDALGPDAAEITPRGLPRARGRSRMPVKARIMDQKVLAGVGNLLADEALWQARIDPRRPANALDEEELDRLCNAIRAANRKAIRGGGVHTGKVIPRAASRRRLPALRHADGAGARSAVAPRSGAPPSRTDRTPRSGRPAAQCRARRVRLRSSWRSTTLTISFRY